MKHGARHTCPSSCMGQPRRPPEEVLPSHRMCACCAQLLRPEHTMDQLNRCSGPGDSARDGEGAWAASSGAVGAQHCCGTSQLWLAVCGQSPAAPLLFPWDRSTRTDSRIIISGGWAGAGRGLGGGWAGAWLVGGWAGWQLGWQLYGCMGFAAAGWVGPPQAGARPGRQQARTLTAGAVTSGWRSCVIQQVQSSDSLSNGLHAGMPWALTA
jgi:hypothetical protein